MSETTKVAAFLDCPVHDGLIHPVPQPHSLLTITSYALVDLAFRVASLPYTFVCADSNRWHHSTYGEWQIEHNTPRRVRIYN